MSKDSALSFSVAAKTLNPKGFKSQSRENTRLKTLKCVSWSEMDRKSCTKSNFSNENKKTHSPFNEAAKLLVFAVATLGRRCGITSCWRPPRPRPEYFKVPNMYMVESMTSRIVITQGKQREKRLTISYLALKLGYINKTYTESLYFNLANAFFFSAEIRIYKQRTHTHTVSGAENLYFKFVWLLQNRFLLSISRKWKTIKVSAFHARLIS